MEHAPFIWLSYGLGAVVLAWTALAPLARKRRALARIRQIQQQVSHDDPNA